MEVKLIGGPLDGATVDIDITDPNVEVTSGPLEFGGLVYDVADGVGRFREGNPDEQLKQAMTDES